MSKSAGTQITNPFVGLRAFEESEDYLFFGRNNQIGELLEKLSQNRFLAVIGSSGSGKSSLVKSGLLPAIFSGFMTIGSNWRAALMRPGEDPIGYLTKELAYEGTLYTGIENKKLPYASIIESGLRRSENGLVQVYKDAHLPDNENLLIVVDQFEELFRFSQYEKENKPGKSDAIHFIQILLTAVQQTECPVYVLLTMRADFLGDCAEFRGLPEAINEGQYLVPRMRRDEIREAITGPVTVSSAAISQRLVTRLLNDINNDTDQLPILQHALMRTWDAWYTRNERDTPIDFEDYEKIGTMKAALSQHADEAYAELNIESERQICELMFKALTDKAADVRGIRRPRTINDLCILAKGSERVIKKVIEVFRKEGRTFLMPSPGIALTGNSIIDISHESLMRIWDRLAKWIEEEARKGDIYLRLANSAQLKEQGQRGLLKNPELEIALKWKEQNNPTEKWAEGYKVNFEQAIAYLEDSRREDVADKKNIADKEATRKRYVIAIFFLFIMGSFVIASFILAVYFNGLKVKAFQEKARAELATREAIKSDRITKVALNSLNESARELEHALIRENISDSLRQIALADAYQKQHEADIAAAIARQNTKEVLKEKQLVEFLLLKNKGQNLKIAANEYARLIREGPSEENKNKEEFYGRNYFLAYTYHFNQLKESIAKEDRPAYQSLRTRLYYNNDLYKRIYENFLIIKLGDEVIKKEETLKLDFDTKVFFTNDTSISLKKNDKGLVTIINISSGNKNISDALARKDQTFISLAVSKKRQLIICSTNDNFIYVFNNMLERVDSISMGAKVTALDFFDDYNRSIIFFGTASGCIGYIYYDINKKNQPVFENILETEITAIHLFSRSNTEETFLLATGIGSSPKVYRLDVNSLKPNKHLIGNELPYYKKEFGNIIDAEYNPKIKRVILLTSTGTYSWNPFTDDLLDKLKEKENFYPESPGASALIKETKFY